MNKRQAKKRRKQIEKFVRENFDVLEDDCNYRTIPIRCYSCQNYESGDMSVGLTEGCEAPEIYDENDEIIEKMNDKVIYYMGVLGYGCPYYRKIIKKNK